MVIFFEKSDLAKALRMSAATTLLGPVLKPQETGRTLENLSEKMIIFFEKNDHFFEKNGLAKPLRMSAATTLLGPVLEPQETGRTLEGPSEKMIIFFEKNGLVKAPRRAAATTWPQVSRGLPKPLGASQSLLGPWKASRKK